MTTETDIQAEIDLLKARIADTRVLYREVCVLLFFRHGVTPTASRLYQYVRRGSMGVPAQALAQFWDDLRERARVEIDHPGVPDALRQAAGQALAGLWEQATQLARDELAALRVEAQAQARQALASLAAAEQRQQQQEAEMTAMRALVEQQQEQQRVRDELLAQEQRGHAATQARTQALEQQIAQLRQELETSRQHFSAELDKGREAVALASRRAQDTERRALRDMDAERTARAGVSKQLDAARAQLAQEQHERQAQALQASALQARLAAELDAARLSASQAQRKVSEQHTQVQQLMQSLARQQAEASALRGVLQQGRPAPRMLRKNRRAAQAPGPAP